MTKCTIITRTTDIPRKPGRKLAVARSWFFLPFLCWLMGMTASAQQPTSEAKTGKQTAVRYTYKIIAVAGGTYGYDLYAGDKLKIHQPSIPAIPGNKGFATREAAGKVARLAIRKMEGGESLPTISVEELKKLKVVS